MPDESSAYDFDAESIDAIKLGYVRALRIATAFAGPSAARGIARRAVGYALKRSGTASGPDDLTRMVVHGGVMLTRRLPDRPRVADPLMPASPADPDAVAFVRAVRSLNRQQVEAVLLAEFEGVDVRGIATSMDLSRDAAAVHLDEARKSLQMLSGSDYRTRMKELADRYKAFAPSDPERIEWVRGKVSRHAWTRSWKRALRWFATTLLAAAIAATVWWLYQHIDF